MSTRIKDVFVTSLVTLLILASLFHSVCPANLCSSIGLCCKHRDSHCVAQKIQANHTVDTSELPCYCDHACLHLDDCCPDYKQFCGVFDCQLSEWGPWTPCSSRCGIGHQERHRIVLHQPSNGGAKCSHLMQSKQCKGLACYEDDLDKSDTTQTKVTQEAEIITTENSRSFEQETEANYDTTEVPKSNGYMENSSEESDKPRQISLAKNINTKSCMEMVIIRASIGCQHHDERLHIGTRICVQCPQESGSMLHSEPTCTELTEAPIRKFRISGHCHGKLTFLAKTANQECKCSYGLHFELVR